MMKKYFSFIACVLIIVLGFSVYMNSLNGRFVWDDEDLVKNNIYIKDRSYIGKIFTEDIEGGAGKRSSLYHPFQIFTYAIDYSFWKLNPLGYHLTNVLLHILVGLALFWLIAIIFSDTLLAFFTGILFIAHPIHTEAISYISSRSDPLFTLFTLLCFVFYIKYLDSKKIHIYILAILCYLLALLSKEFSMIFPVLLLLYHYTFKKRLDFKAFIPILCLTVFYIISRLTILSSFFIDPAYFSTTLLDRIPGFFVAIANYIRLLFLPFNLHMEYGNRVFSWMNPSAIIGVIMTSALLIYGFKERNKSRPIFFPIYWFFMSLLPISNLYPINAYMAEHWLYLPSIGFFLIAARILVYLYRDRNIKTLTAILVVTLLIFYSCSTVTQNTFWKEPIAIYNRTLRYAPDSAGVHSNLGNAYREKGEIEKAIASYEEALEIDPKLVDALNNLGTMYSERGQDLRAMTYFERAIEIDPNKAELYNNLGITYIGTDDKKAIELFKKAIEVNPHYAYAYNSLGNAYSMAGKTERAIEAYNKAIKIDPGYALAYYNLGNAHRDLNKYEKAVDSYLKALTIKPDFPRALNDLGIAYHMLIRNEEAIASFQKVLEMDPHNASAYNNIGNIYTVIGKNKKAIMFLEKAIELNPVYAEAYNNLGNAYVAIKENDKAIISYSKAITIVPDYAIAHSNLAVVYYYEKMYDLAITHYDEALKLGIQGNPEFLALLKPYRNNVSNEK